MDAAVSAPICLAALDCLLAGVLVSSRRLTYPPGITRTQDTAYQLGRVTRGRSRVYTNRGQLYLRVLRERR